MYARHILREDRRAGAGPDVEELEEGGVSQPRAAGAGVVVVVVVVDMERGRLSASLYLLRGVALAAHASGQQDLESYIYTYSLQAVKPPDDAHHPVICGAIALETRKPD